MGGTLSISPRSSALLVMDYQTGIVGMLGGDQARLVARTANVLDRARGAGMKVIYVVVAFRPGYPELSDRNVAFGTLRESGRLIEGAAGTEVHPSVAPKDGDLVVIKRRVSAFSGSDLEVLLRAGGIDTLVLAGIATSGVVLSTLRQAADADYRLVVISDACADRDDEVHRMLMEKIFPRQATVVTSESLIAAMT